MSIVVLVFLCLLAVPVAALVRACFRPFGVSGFGVAWVSFVGVGALCLQVLGLDWRFGLAAAAVVPFLVVWGLGRLGVLEG